LFELHFLESTLEFYKKESNTLLNSDDDPGYVKYTNHIIKRIQQESNLFLEGKPSESKFLDLTTKKRLISIVRNVLFKENILKTNKLKKIL
jgi:hypothetical protein